MILLVLGVFGLIAGSFANATIWRLHAQSDPHRRGKRARNLSITTGRSQCNHCGHLLSAFDLIPVVSYLWLRGKCRYCGKSIGDTPVAELLTAGLYTASYLWWPYNVTTPGLTEGRVLLGLWLLFIAGFVILALYDLKWFLLPDRVVVPLLVLAVLQVIIRTVWFHEGWAELSSALWGVGLIAGLFFVLHIVSKGAWLGFGDVKLALVLGLLAGGALAALLLVFIASLSGSLAAIPLFIQRKPVAKACVPFGPFLLLATVLVVLFGQPLIAWYMGLLNPMLPL